MSQYAGLAPRTATSGAQGLPTHEYSGGGMLRPKQRGFGGGEERDQCECRTGGA